MLVNLSFRRILWTGLVTTLAALATNLLFFALTHLFGEQYNMPLSDPISRVGPMPVTMVIVSTLLLGFLATVLFGLLVRFVKNPMTMFLSISITALIVSFGGPYYLPEAGVQTKVLLSIMHILTALFITGGILLLNRKK